MKRHGELPLEGALPRVICGETRQATYGIKK